MKVAHVERTNQAPSRADLATLRVCVRLMFRGVTPDDDQAFMRFFSDLWASEPGRVLTINASFPRNSRFHRKFFAMLNAAFEMWDPPPSAATSVAYGGEVHPVEKDFDQFRADVTIMAGFYDATYRVDGSVRLQPKSISFANMDDVEFEKLYNRVLNVILAKVLTDVTAGDIEQAANRILEFAS